jgi:polysaccharide pyruvyl transferase WcaK-like protein
MLKPKRIIKIAHLHVWDKNNKGDVAIVLAVQESLRRNFPACRIINFPVQLLKTGKDADARKINQADLVIIGGGGIFYSYFLPYRQEFIKLINKPIVLFGLGYIKEVDAPELTPAAVRSIMFLAARAKFIGVRDNNTKKFLLKNGMPGKKITVVGDPAALLAEKPSTKFRFKQKKVIRLGFNLNYSGWLGFGKWRDDILGAYRAVAEYFLKTYGGPDGTGLEIYYLKHHPGEDKIYPALGIKNLRVVDLKPAEQKYIYGKLDLVVGMMLHAGVIAFGAGTPEISVAYDLRNYSFAEFIGHKELVVNLKDLKKGELLKRVKLVFKNRATYAREFSRLKTIIDKKQQAFLKRLF